MKKIKDVMKKNIPKLNIKIGAINFLNEPIIALGSFEIKKFKPYAIKINDKIEQITDIILSLIKSYPFFKYT
jgi:hypothetical protein